MNSSVVLVREERFIRSADGRVWSRWGTGHQTWIPFLSTFTDIVLVARVQDVVDPPPGGTLVSHDQLRICPVTYFHGPWEYLKRIRPIHADLERWLGTNIPMVFRVPSPLANALYRPLSSGRRPFAVEVAGDPYDQMSPGAMRHPLRPLFRRHYAGLQKKLCGLARVIRYVTCSALQRRYPAAKTAAVHTVSDVFLPPEAFYIRRQTGAADPLRLVFVGMLEQLYKGPDTLIEATAYALRSGARLTLTIIGDGEFRRNLQDLAERLGIASAVEFLGVCDRQRIQEILDKSGLFVLPSRQEGLPRAMLEAMARSLPCLGTDVGGIPELLDKEFLVPPNAPSALATKLMQFASDRPALLAAGERNRAVAQQYRLSVKLERERSFARDVRQLCR